MIQALSDDGIDVDEHLFNIPAEKKATPAAAATPAKRTVAAATKTPVKTNGAATPKTAAAAAKDSAKTNADDDEKAAADEADADEVALDITDDLMVKDEAEDGDEIVDEVGEVDKENFDEIDEKFCDDAEAEDTAAKEEAAAAAANAQVTNDSASNADNEDSLNLTIGEDEEKIFQDEVSLERGTSHSFEIFLFFFHLQEAADEKPVVTVGKYCKYISQKNTLFY